MSDFKYFKLEDFDCQETGDNEMDAEFIHKLDQLREACGFPFIITSGFRSKDHSSKQTKLLKALRMLLLKIRKATSL